MSKQLYKHRYGGLYEFQEIIRYTDRDGDGVLYRHIYPFDDSLWVRPASEFFDGRFEAIAQSDVDTIMDLMTREEYQDYVKRNKVASKKEVA